MVAAADFVASAACPLPDEAKRALVQAKVDALPEVKRDDVTGLRIDISLENETTGETWGRRYCSTHGSGELPRQGAQVSR